MYHYSWWFILKEPPSFLSGKDPRGKKKTKEERTEGAVLLDFKTKLNKKHVNQLWLLTEQAEAETSMVHNKDYFIDKIKYQHTYS